jgi:hypothetical protein
MTAENTFFSSSCGMFTKLNYSLSQETNPEKFKSAGML